MSTGNYIMGGSIEHLPNITKHKTLKGINKRKEWLRMRINKCKVYDKTLKWKLEYNLLVAKRLLKLKNLPATLEILSMIVSAYDIDSYTLEEKKSDDIKQKIELSNLANAMWVIKPNSMYYIPKI